MSHSKIHIFASREIADEASELFKTAFNDVRVISRDYGYSVQIRDCSGNACISRWKSVTKTQLKTAMGKVRAK